MCQGRKMLTACRQRSSLIGALTLLCVAGGALGIPASPSGPVPRLASGVGCGQSGLRGRNGSPAAAAPGLKMRKDVAEPGLGAVEAIDALRGGGLPKKLGGKNVGLLVILLSLLYLPRAMAQCHSRLMPQRGGAKPIIQRLGCGPGLSVTNMATLSGLAMVLVNSRNYDRCQCPPPEPSTPSPFRQEQNLTTPICLSLLAGTGDPSSR